MLIGTQTDFIITHFGNEAGIRMLAEAGFDSIDYSLFNYQNKDKPFTLPDNEFRAFFENIGHIIRKNNLVTGQTHSPFPTYTDNCEEDEFLLDILIKSIKATAYLGSKYTIIHPAMVKERRYGCYTEEMKEINMKRYISLYNCLEEYDVYCCIENMFSRDSNTRRICPTTCTTAEEMADYIDTLNGITKSSRYVACFDVGHSNLIHYDGYETVNPVDMIHILGDRLKTLHVHDNDGANDNHMPPGFGIINWQDVCKALRAIRYDGIFTLEADNLGHKSGPGCAQEAENLLYSIAKNMTDKYDL